MLRFWWRAMRGAGFDNPQRLLEAEGRVWGATGGRSPVVLTTTASDRGQRVEALRTERTNDGRIRYIPKKPAYALFPVQQRDSANQEREIANQVMEGGRATLEISFSAGGDHDAVRAALWAWCNFGGYGARTRRGAGAIYCRNWAFAGPRPEDRSAVLDWLTEQFRGLAILDRTPRPWPTLAGAALVVGPRLLPVQSAWEEGIEMYRRFRQNRHPGTGGRPGRSLWPEPDQIRRERKMHHSRHAPVHPEQYFPRAILGMPIIFQFKDRGDPLNQSLEPSPLSGGADDQPGRRLASPIVLKPLLVAPDRAYPLVLRLNSTSLAEANGLDLLLKQNKPAAPVRHVRVGPRRADEEFLSHAETEWRVKRITL
jgi:CRISPR-associated protein Cmr1